MPPGSTTAGTDRPSGRERYRERRERDDRSPPVTDEQARPCAKHGGPKEAKRDYCAEPDWDRKCEVCDEVPVVCSTGLCGPCTFGEAETTGGNW